MDPALLREREKFLKANSRNIGVPKIPSVTPSISKPSSSKPKKKQPKSDDPLKHMKSLPNMEYNDRASEFTNQNSSLFGMMAKIVDFMKKKYLEGAPWPLSLRDCLDEMKAAGMSRATEKWLTEKLPENKKLTWDGDGKFCFKPPYKLRSDASIIAQLQKNYRDGKGAILLSELNECFAKAEERMEKLGPACITIPCQVNKRKDKAYFYNDTEVGIDVDDEFKALWRSSNVDALDEKKIDEYLNKHGLSIIKDQGPKRYMHSAPKRKAAKRRGTGKIQNTHMSDILINFEQT
uniref:Transcription initiation factor IIE subunit beta n=1 Tax=Panagrellus redivivus TaxID=6233 RepID=A0A7E4ZVH5_PANRE